MVLSTTYSKFGYALDTIFYAVWVLLFAAIMVEVDFPQHIIRDSILMTSGLILWTLLEYILHRFVLHHVEPFKAIHEKHHDSPSALIATSTYVGALSILLTVFLPFLFVFGIIPAISLTSGVVLGYFVYGIWHYGCHAWKITNRIFFGSKKNHAIHHAYYKKYYGVTTQFWDMIFRTNFSRG